MKKYLKIARIVNYTSAKGMRALTRKEIELYHQLPKDMKTVAPVLLLSALPFANYVIFPLAYLYPRLLLTSHFWSEAQKLEFRETFLRQRSAACRKVFRYLQSKNSVQHLNGDMDSFTKLNYILGLLGSGLHPTADEILEVKHIFAKAPFQLESLVSGHLNSLCQLHGLHGMWMKRFRLSEHSFLIHHMDLAIKREGGVHNMPLEGEENRLKKK
jgi:LETM1-like protein